MKGMRIGLVLTLTVVVFLMATGVASAFNTQTSNGADQAAAAATAADVTQHKTLADTGFDQAVPAPAGTPGWVVGIVLAAAAAAACAVVIILVSRRGRYAERPAVASPIAATGADRKHLKAA